MDAFQDIFHALDAWLRAHRQWWQFQPFHHRQSRWATMARALHECLESLSAEDALALGQNQKALVERLSAFIPDANLGADLLETFHAPLPVIQDCLTENKLRYGISDRKWAQIEAFASRVLPATPVLEWCAGKGHLGRLMASTGADTLSLEWQQALCDDGQQLADRANLPMQFVCCDVLNDDTSPYLKQGRQVLALHACGDLHVHLLREAAQHQSPGVNIAPCCYNRTAGTNYQPLSKAAKGSALLLSRSDLALPLKQTVTAGPGQQQRRDRELAWRLGFDLLQRDIREDDNYLPLPAIPTRYLSQDFETFCHWALAQKGLTLSGSCLPLTDYTLAGQQRVASVRQMELVQALYQRPLELWLLLDRVLFLEEAGYTVQLGTFCDYAITPRNWLIQARFKDHHSSAAHPH